MFLMKLTFDVAMSPFLMHLQQFLHFKNFMTLLAFIILLHTVFTKSVFFYITFLAESLGAAIARKWTLTAVDSL